MIALMGGAFDPVHFGHIRPILEVLSYEEVSAVYLVPCAIHPDKDKPHADVEDRLAMLRMVERDGLHIDIREINRGGVSYSVDTVLEIRGEIGLDVSLAFIVGQDVSDTISTWKRAEMLPQLANLIILHRSVNTSRVPVLWSEVSSIAELSQYPAGRCLHMKNELVNVSSTAIRQMLARHEQPRYMLPGNIWNYIRRNHLYGWEENTV